ncbi:helix-turn-helix transcriptional regulator [Virgibacillus sp. YIM 98842]|uniref:helix-turn-helix transcriptional regulator n=1 Tax=Virgibacillus sp. YIM 98842 TaxID=2663533 RepID=UPI0023E39150|nr:helix-turn-helix transcriptional regulator [Virgibacillus sp. YIM 98842]
MKIKNNVRYFRRLLDMTQEELSEGIGVHRQTIIAIEKQKHNPSIDVVLLLASTLNKSVEELFFFEESKVN